MQGWDIGLWFDPCGSKGQAKPTAEAAWTDPGKKEDKWVLWASQVLLAVLTSLP